MLGLDAQAKRPSHVDSAQTVQHVADAEVSAWTCDDVCNWMASQGFGDHCGMIRMRQLDGPGMLQLSQSELHAVLDLPDSQIVRGAQAGVYRRETLTLEPFDVEWDTAGVCAWLVGQGFDEGAEVVAEQELDGFDLLELKAEEIAELFAIDDEDILGAFMAAVNKS